MLSNCSYIWNYYYHQYLTALRQVKLVNSAIKIGIAINFILIENLKILCLYATSVENNGRKVCVASWCPHYDSGLPPHS